MISLPDILAGVIVVALNAYVLLAGADFGGGVWDLLARGPRRDAQREVIAEAIGPVWEANHVWLILALVVLFTAFPPVFAELGTRLHIPFALVLIGIVLRGSAFAFRSYGGEPSGVQLRWGHVFAIASAVTPLLLGTALGAIAAGRLGEAGSGNGNGFVAVYVRPWLAPFPISVGILAIACFSLLAAVYLTLESDERALQEDFARRALAAQGVVIVCGLAALGLARSASPQLAQGLLKASSAVLVQGLAALAALIVLVALVRRRFTIARIAAAVEASLILWGWALGQYPYILPPDWTIDGAAAPAATLELLLGALAVGAVVLFPSLLYLFRVFKAKTMSDAVP
ncbi:MAG TPA: cytochrome d ubiquinol oxidase subunit II [Gemmatimonadales bacterium]|nr:cytochrome d ubiquinol oxidase subunit II [Gemmatimonadales bacterium]